jgi:hypothetical protein
MGIDFRFFWASDFAPGAGFESGLTPVFESGFESGFGSDFASGLSAVDVMMTSPVLYS